MKISDAIANVRPGRQLVDAMGNVYVRNPDGLEMTDDSEEGVAGYIPEEMFSVVSIDGLKPRDTLADKLKKLPNGEPGLVDDVITALAYAEQFAEWVDEQGWVAAAAVPKPEISACDFLAFLRREK